MKSYQLRLPGSKSLSNRAMILAALSEGITYLEGLLDADDTQACLAVLHRLGVLTAGNLAEGSLEVTGVAGIFPVRQAEIYCHAAGTVTRFMLPLLAAQADGRYHISADPQMLARPIGSLLNNLRHQGALFESHSGQGLPGTLYARGLSGGVLEVDLQDSSQFLSGLLMAAPLAKTPMTCILTEDLARKPYVHMTCQMMAEWGVQVDQIGSFKLSVGPQRYRSPGQYRVEPDMSTASYFYAAGVLTQTCVQIQGVYRQMLQGDTRFFEALAAMGCEIREEHEGVRVVPPLSRLEGLGVWDMTGYTDTFMTLAALAVFAKGMTCLTGLRHTRHQESDRVHAMAVGLRQLGVEVQETEDSLSIYPPDAQEDVSQWELRQQQRSIRVSSFQDHRIAMSMGLIQLRIPDICIEQSECVSKTCPDYFQRLRIFQR